MSTVSDQVKASGTNAAWQSQVANQLSAVSMPELQMFFGNRAMGKEGIFNQMLKGIGPSGMLPMDQANLASATGALNKGYGQAGFGLGQTIGYGGLRSGEGRLSPGAMNASLGSAMTTLERQRQGALSNLNFQSAQASMTDFNKLMGLMGTGANTAMGLSGGFSQASNQAIAGMNATSDMDQAVSLIGSIVGLAGRVA